MWQLLRNCSWLCCPNIQQAVSVINRRTILSLLASGQSRTKQNCCVSHIVHFSVSLPSPLLPLPLSSVCPGLQSDLNLYEPVSRIVGDVSYIGTVTSRTYNLQPSRGKCLARSSWPQRSVSVRRGSRLCSTYFCRDRALVEKAAVSQILKQRNTRLYTAQVIICN